MPARWEQVPSCFTVMTKEWWGQSVFSQRSLIITSKTTLLLRRRLCHLFGLYNISTCMLEQEDQFWFTRTTILWPFCMPLGVQTRGWWGGHCFFGLMTSILDILKEQTILLRMHCHMLHWTDKSLVWPELNICPVVLSYSPVLAVSVFLICFSGTGVAEDG